VSSPHHNSSAQILKWTRAQADNGEFAWARRHTAQSWRNRYVKNKDSFDEDIAQFLLDHRPNPQAEYPYDVRLQKHYLAEEDEESSEHESDIDEDEDEIDQLIEDTPPPESRPLKRSLRPSRGGAAAEGRKEKRRVVVSSSTREPHSNFE
jgi:hypothetical protein